MEQSQETTAQASSQEGHEDDKQEVDEVRDQGQSIISPDWSCRSMGVTHRPLSKGQSARLEKKKADKDDRDVVTGHAKNPSHKSQVKEVAESHSLVHKLCGLLRLH